MVCEFPFASISDRTAVGTKEVDALRMPEIFRDHDLSEQLAFMRSTRGATQSPTDLVLTNGDRNLAGGIAQALAAQLSGLDERTDDARPEQSKPISPELLHPAILFRPTPEYVKAADFFDDLARKRLPGHTDEDMLGRAALHRVLLNLYCHDYFDNAQFEKDMETLKKQGITKDDIVGFLNQAQKAGITGGTSCNQPVS